MTSLISLENIQYFQIQSKRQNNLGELAVDVIHDANQMRAVIKQTRRKVPFMKRFCWSGFLVFWS
jgi:hypothetical protein